MQLIISTPNELQFYIFEILLFLMFMFPKYSQTVSYRCKESYFRDSDYSMVGLSNVQRF